ncbi:MAG: isocitrate/isopropylmalate family dehydrogenase [Isosphaeraceae bacterium]
MSRHANLQNRRCQPCHGTAPDLAGRGVVNPVAAILSCAMLLDHLGRAEHDNAPARAARQIESAVALTLADSRFRTRDIGGRASTREVTSAVLAQFVEK